VVRSAIAQLSQAVLVVLIVVTIVFVASRISGDPITYLAPFNATPSQIDAIKRSEGLDDPLYQQYGRFLSGVLRLDMGRSFRTSQPAMHEVKIRVGRTLELGVSAILFSLLVGVPLGVVAAVARGTPLDILARVIALIGQATPNFWLRLMLIFFFSLRQKWLPTGGPGGLDHLVLPMITLGAVGAAAIMRLTRSGMLDVLGADFVRTARAKGLSERTVILRHALRHAFLPVMTLLGIQVGRVIAGAVVVETVFAWPGIGRLSINSIQGHDYPVVQACVLVIASTIVLANLLVDFSYRFVDPRISSR
jgi:peptide/nickel transport system permease protein